jgi:chemotaxis protein methyltransferase CheR
VVQVLARHVERVCGIEISGIMEAKLGRVLASVSLAALEAWVGRLHRLPSDDPEWLSLIESLTVHETFFHRDRSQFDLLRQRLLAALIATAASGTCRLRFWSAGCATGEEAYTLAITALLALRDAGFASESADGGIVCSPPWTIEVLGSDISRVVLARAVAATYPTEELGPFRHLPKESQRFFPLLRRKKSNARAELRAVHETVRRHVRFSPFNLMADTPPLTGCDIVLCRNVLIYLTLAARAKALSVLRQALRPGGYLLLGPTDALTEKAAYVSHWGDGAVAYRLKHRHG